MKKRKPFLLRHKALSFTILLIVIGVVGLLVRAWLTNYTNTQFQKSIQSFYEVPTNLDSYMPGTLLRFEKILDVNLQNTTTYRVLYVTQLPNKTNAVSSGVVYIPNTPPPAQGRNVVAWAHGTLGFGNNCVPSRNPAGPLSDTANWLQPMLNQGWAVVATDYTGVGTAGTPRYLIGESEAYDVFNSIRAAQSLPDASLGKDIGLYGHSQGGHSVLFSAQLAKEYAPEYRVVGVAAAAPAAQLVSLFSQQYNSAIAWGIGPDAAVSWPAQYPQVSTSAVMSEAALRSYYSMAYGCVANELGSIELRSLAKEKFFKADPMQNTGWYEVAALQTPSAAKIPTPIYIAQGLSDTVVLPNTTALFAQNACKEGSNLTLNWLGNTSHTQVAEVAGPAVVDWLSERFAGQTTTNTCALTMPVSAANSPPSPQ